MKNAKKTGAAVAGLLVLGVGALGTAAALDIIDGPDQVLSVFESSTEKSAFSLEATDLELHGKDAMDVSWTVKNNDAQAHDAEVTVQLLDDAGAPIEDGGTVLQQSETISVDAGDTYTGVGSFAKDGLVEEYASTFVTVEHVSS